MTEINSKVYLGLPSTPTQLLDNSDFELHTGDDFDDWTENIPLGFTELLANKDFELVVGNDFTSWTENTDDGTVEDEQVVVHGDTHSVKITHQSALGGDTYVSQTEVVTIGVTYTFGAWVKGEWVIGLSNGYPNITKKTGTAADWEYQTVTRTATTTTLYAIASSEINNGVMYVDDATLYVAIGSIVESAEVR